MQSAETKKIKLSVVIVYTNVNQLNEAVSCIEKQTLYPSSETILLDNRENRFSSAASTLNFGAEKASGDVVVFMHQDVYLWNTDILENYYNFITNHPDAIVGLAGIAKADEKIYFDFCETKEKIYRGIPTDGKIIEAISVDECMFAMAKSLWQKLKFDEIVCNDWHFYGADICFNNTISGGKNYIFSTKDACHESKGNASNSRFRKSLKAMVKKYKGKLPRISTTCVNVKCNTYALSKHFFKSYASQIIRRLFR